MVLMRGMWGPDHKRELLRQKQKCWKRKRSLVAQQLGFLFTGFLLDSTIEYVARSVLRNRSSSTTRDNIIEKLGCDDVLSQSRGYKIGRARVSIRDDHTSTELNTRK